MLGVAREAIVVAQSTCLHRKAVHAVLLIALGYVVEDCFPIDGAA